jgi:hypothetical protein
MKRFSVLAAFAVLSTVTGLVILSARADDKSATSAKAKAPDEHHAMYASCAKICADCMVVCGTTTHHCAEMVEAGKKEHLKHMQLTAACAEFCALSAKLTSCHSDLAPAACEACAKACDMCGAACEKFPDMPEMKTCAESCKKCAASCREMAKMTGHKH